MISDGVQVQAERLHGACVLRISGELDLATADTLGERADAAVAGMPQPVLVDVSGLTFIDACGARALNAVIQTLPDGRLAALRSCPYGIRRILDILALFPGSPPAGHREVPDPGATALSGRVRRARLEGVEVTLTASAIIAEVIDTCVRLAVTVERTALIREQGRRARAASRAAVEEAGHARQVRQAGGSKPGPLAQLPLIFPVAGPRVRD